MKNSLMKQPIKPTNTMSRTKDFKQQRGSEKKVRIYEKGCEALTLCRNYQVSNIMVNNLTMTN